MECGRVTSLVATAGTRTIRVWDIVTGDEIYCLPKSVDRRILTLSFGKGDEGLLIGYDDASIRCIEFGTTGEKWNHAFKVQGDTEQLRPHLMSISPDNLQVIVAYRGKPMLAWNLDALDSQPQVCVFSEDVLSSGTEGLDTSVWKAATPERIIWRPGLPSVLIMYNYASLFEWDLEDESLR
ncbi:hypothetical protein MFIFM68171_11176 [Madurella fahalii]|uniref:Uncharacterized protein n=1 Tax=Madurella fahalii TaxID=1157608 RepID=A0ABQ0GT93_9PEZI